ncbi:glycosyltransferase [Massilia sp. METH4]|uniref:glycosyltransferase n=1 Tax=Massilia sp. METH4 TaxID=3123041 RepID=UPI0030CC9E53
MNLLDSKTATSQHTPSLSTRRSICFVSETRHATRPILDPSVRYRCYHPAEKLAAEGHWCTVKSASQFFEMPSLGHDVYVFHRPNMARDNFAQILQALRRQGATLIADYDDLIFGTAEIALISSAVKNGTLSEERAIEAFAGNLAGLRQFDKVTTSTAPLAERVREFNPGAQVEVVPNFLPESIVGPHAELRTPFIRRPPTSIGYFSGTRSHDKDFPIVGAVLHRVLSENPDFNLLIVGPVQVPRGLASLPNVTTAPATSFLRLPSLMSMCATVIAPLETTAFNACKSRVKFLEAAIGGCRLIATPIPDMAAVGDAHITLVSTTDAWYEALSAPLDAEARSALVQRNLAFLGANDGIDGLRSFVS